MIISAGSVDNVLGAHLQKIYKSNATGMVDKVSRKDVATISRFATLVERGRASVAELPDVRADVVKRARQAIQNGALPHGTDMAASMINKAVKGQV